MRRRAGGVSRESNIFAQKSFRLSWPRTTIRHHQKSAIAYECVQEQQIEQVLLVLTGYPDRPTDPVASTGFHLHQIAGKPTRLFACRCKIGQLQSIYIVEGSFVRDAPHPPKSHSPIQGSTPPFHPLTILQIRRLPPEAKRRIVTAVTASAAKSCNQSGIIWLNALFRIH
jgi:hypothetical protein